MWNSLFTSYGNICILYSSLLCFLMCTSDSNGFFQSQLVVDGITIKAIVHNMHGVCIPQHSSIACSNTHLYSIAIRNTNMQVLITVIAECLSMRHIIVRGQQGVYFSAWLSIYLLHKAEKPSVRLSDRRDGNSVVSACIDVGLALHVSYVLWHVQVCFKKFLSAIVCPLEC